MCSLFFETVSYFPLLRIHRGYSEDLFVLSVKGGIAVIIAELCRLCWWDAALYQRFGVKNTLLLNVLHKADAEIFFEGVDYP